ncbi:MAG: phosphatidylglycerol lysyltransferase domain-containing protein [Cypionkella sp.]
MTKQTALARAVAPVAQEQVNWRKLLARAVLSLLASGGFLWLLSQRLDHIDPADLIAGFETLPLANWITALGLTAISFAAAGQYDAVMHRHLRTGVAPAAARRAGICAIAVSQTLGLGVVTGSLLRWRMLPGQSLRQATGLTAAVTLSFLLGWGFVTAIALAALPNAPFRAAASLVLAAYALAICIASMAPHRVAVLPNGFTLGRLLVLTAIDTIAAAIALWMLCPATLDLAFLTLLPVFLLAFGAGLISGAPGGVGPFEVALLALLPDQPDSVLLAAILAWRACYYALPALAGAALAIRGAKPMQAQPVPPPFIILPRAEFGLIHQGDHSLQATSTGSAFLLARTRHCLIALFDPITPATRSTLNTSLTNLADMAQADSRSPVLYKSSARTAAVARQRGKSCIRIAAEAVVAPQHFRLDCPKRAGLRRKLRRAASAGILVTQPPVVRDWAALDLIADAWARAHGGERGFSMGRYSRAYLSHQRLYIAWKDQRPIAFVSFHTGQSDWALDLIRYGKATPDGTIHLLIQTAIKDAQALNIIRLSLADVPDYSALPVTLHPLSAHICRHSTGLAQFKSAFAPDWRPRYLIAQNPAALVLAAAEIARAIHRPGPLSTQASQPATDIEFASARNSWHRQLK